MRLWLHEMTSGDAAEPGERGIVERVVLQMNRRIGLRLSLASALGLCMLGTFMSGLAETPAAKLDPSTVIQGIDAAVKYRIDHIAGYTVTEQYKVFRGGDEKNTVAAMTVKTTYKRDSGKNYQIVSEDGSTVIRHMGLYPILDREKEINLPGNVQKAWITSANYDMAVKPGMKQIGRHDCIEVTIHPKEKAPNLIDGTVWVDAKDFTIVRLEGVASKAPSIFAGTTHMMRDYADLSGFSMATHARAESSTFLYGKTVMTIDYIGYQILLADGTHLGE